MLRNNWLPINHHFLHLVGLACICLSKMHGHNKTKYLYCIRKTIQTTCIDTGEEQFEQINSFKYLGTVVNTDNSIEEDIKDRIAARNRAFHNLTFCWPRIMQWFLVIVQLDVQIPFNIFIYSSLHISSMSCSSSGETDCINTASGKCHSVLVAVSCAGWE